MRVWAGEGCLALWFTYLSLSLSHSCCLSLSVRLWLLPVCDGGVCKKANDEIEVISRMQ